MESTARRRVNRAWDCTFQRGQLIYTELFKLGYGIEKRLSIRVLRVAEYFGRRAELRNFAQIHYGNLIGHLTHYAKVMRNQYVRKLEFFLQLTKQFQYLRLRKHVDGGCRLIQHHQLGVRCKRTCGLVARMTRSALLEILNEDYITAAKSYGVREGKVLWRYALKNSLGATATVVALSMGYSLTNTFLTETIFSWPGLGSYVSKSVTTLDYPAIMGIAIISAIFYVILNLVADIIIALDPRIRL